MLNKLVHLVRSCCYPNNQDWHSTQDVNSFAAVIYRMAVNKTGIGEEKSATNTALAAVKDKPGFALEVRHRSGIDALGGTLSKSSALN